MGRKSKIKRDRDRDAFIAARTIGGAAMVQTSKGNILLNTTKHFCLKKPYTDEEFESRMFYELKKKREAFEKMNKENDNG